MVKTPPEVQLLAHVATSTDHAIVGAAHHILLLPGGTSEVGYRHNIIVHCMERLLDLVGHHGTAQVLSGENCRKFWSLFSRPFLPGQGVGFHRMMVEGDVVRAEMRASSNGYWSDAARMLTVGEGTPEQKTAYHGLARLKEAAAQSMKPGTKCSEVFGAVGSDRLWS